MRNNLAQEITSRLKLKDVMEFYGIRFNSRGFAKCPFHNEKTASLSIKNEHYKCFGCGAYGGVIDFVMNYFNVNFIQATTKLNIDFNLGLVQKKLSYRDRVNMVEEKRIQRNINLWKAEKHDHYLQLCEIHAGLYRLILAGESSLEPYRIELEDILDTFNDEEARVWEIK